VTGAVSVRHRLVAGLAALAALVAVTGCSTAHHHHDDCDAFALAAFDKPHPRARSVHKAPSQVKKKPAAPARPTGRAAAPHTVMASHVPSLTGSSSSSPTATATHYDSGCCHDD
jgi:hypothetical protein